MTFKSLRLCIVLIALASALASASATAASLELYLFESSHARAVAGLARQQARAVLAKQEYVRAENLYKQKFISTEEFETNRAALDVSVLDLQIATLRAEQARITLDLAQALARHGQKIPICRRKPAKEEDTVSKLLKKPKTAPWKPQILTDLMTRPSGTRIIPREDPPPNPTPGGNPGGGTPGGTMGGTPGGSPGSTPGGAPGGMLGGTPSGGPGGTPGGDLGGEVGGAMPSGNPGGNLSGTPGGRPGG